MNSLRFPLVGLLLLVAVQTAALNVGNPAVQRTYFDEWPGTFFDAPYFVFGNDNPPVARMAGGMPSPGTIPCHGKVTAWHIYARARTEATTLYLQVFRLAKEPTWTGAEWAPGYYQLIGQNVVALPAAGGVHSFAVSSAEQIAVRPGDFIGFTCTQSAPLTRPNPGAQDNYGQGTPPAPGHWGQWFGRSNPCTFVGYTIPLKVDANGQIVNGDVWPVYYEGQFNGVDSDGTSWTGGLQKGCRYSLNADVEPIADPQPGYEAKSRAYEDPSEKTWLDPSGQVPGSGSVIPYDGKVSSWTLYAKSLGDVRLQAFRPVSGGYELIGQNTVTVTDYGVNTFSIDPVDQFYVKAGDFLGWTGSGQIPMDQVPHTDLAPGNYGFWVICDSENWPSYVQQPFPTATVPGTVVPSTAWPTNPWNPAYDGQQFLQNPHYKFSLNCVVEPVPPAMATVGYEAKERAYTNAARTMTWYDPPGDVIDHPSGKQYPTGASVIPIAGKLTSWSLWTSDPSDPNDHSAGTDPALYDYPQDLTLQVFRPNRGGAYEVVGVNNVTVEGPGLNTIAVEPYDQIEVQPGDVIGYTGRSIIEMDQFPWSTSQPSHCGYYCLCNPARPYSYEADPPPTARYITMSVPLQPFPSAYADLTGGSGVEYFRSPGYQLSLNATVSAGAQAMSIADAKKAANGAQVICTGVVTAAFADFFYMEKSDRSNGIRVVGTATVGKTAAVTGTVSTLLSEERYILADTVDENSGTALAPLGMNNRTLGGGDWGEPPVGQAGVADGSGANNIGLLVKTTGRVTEKGTGWFTISDGSGVSVRVNGAPPSGNNAYVAVTGACSCEKVSGLVQRLIEATSVQVIIPGTP